MKKITPKELETAMSMVGIGMHSQVTEIIMKVINHMQDDSKSDFSIKDAVKIKQEVEDAFKARVESDIEGVPEKFEYLTTILQATGHQELAANVKNINIAYTSKTKTKD